jgi:hypothetical protein
VGQTDGPSGTTDSCEELGKLNGAIQTALERVKVGRVNKRRFLWKTRNQKSLTTGFAATND